MNLKKLLVGECVEGIDCLTMSGMSKEDYAEFLKQEGLFWVDYHGFLRSSCAEYPLATSKEQLELLMSYLWDIRDNLK